MADHEMIQYLRGDGNHPIGVLVALYKEETQEVRIGWSKCNKKDQFEKNKGLKIARARAANDSRVAIPSSREFLKEVNQKVIVDDETIAEVPALKVIPNLKEQYERFIVRVVTYFKAISPDHFFVCGPEAEQMEFVNTVVDARNDDIDRQRRKAEEAKE